MPFHSYGFIFCILPVTLIGFYGLKKILQSMHRPDMEQIGAILKLWMIAMSVWFLSRYGLRNLFVLGVSLVWNSAFLFADRICIGRQTKAADKRVLASVDENPNWPKTKLALAVLGNIAFLGFFKYSASWFPVAISFYTFEQIAVLIDASGRNKRMQGQRTTVTPLSYLLYVLYFPKLLEGPIARYDELDAQWSKWGESKFDSEKFLRGLMLFGIGMGKKILLADQLGRAVDEGFLLAGTLMPMDALFVTLSFSLQLYFDFSGYCDMGEGVSMMLGITLPRNFNSPFQSETTNEHWDRWHMTLTAFFTDYLYVGLGGNRKGRIRTYCNVMIVFFISGLWHGNTLPYLVWGLLQGAFSMLYKVLDLSPVKGLRHGMRVAIQFAIWSLCMVIFRGKTLTEGLTVLSRYFAGKWKILFATKSVLDEAIPAELSFLLSRTGLGGTVWATVVGSWGMILLCLGIVFFCKNSYEIAVAGKIKMRWVAWAAIVLVWSTISITGVSTFLYMNF